MSDDPTMTNPAVDVLELLNEAVWRDVSFPTTKFRMEIAHDLVEHKYWGQDGARVESTGLAPLRFSFSAPLTTGIMPGSKETWANLYPIQFRKLVASVQRKDSGWLIHPEYGRILCKAERLTSEWTAERRGGAECELSFVATIDDGQVAEAGESPVTTIDNMRALDNPQFKADLKALLLAKKLPLPPYLLSKTVSLSDLISDVKAIAGYQALLSYKGLGAINALVYHANEIANAAARSRSAFAWPIAQQAEKSKEAAYDLRDQALEASRAIGKFTVPAATTLSGAAQQIAAANSGRIDVKLGDLFALNPEMVSTGIVEAGAAVRYYL